MAATVDEQLWRYALESPAAGIAAAVHEASTLSYFLDQIFYKEAGRVRITDWHQDTAYLNATGDDLVRVWLPLDPTPRELAIEVVRGSHRWNVTYQVNIVPEAGGAAKTGGYSYGGIVQDPHLPPVPAVNRYRDSFDILGWAVDPGDVVVFHGHILHGAGGLAHHPRTRRALAVMYAGPEERFVQRSGIPVPDIASLRGISLEAGARLQDYPQAYPVAWPRLVQQAGASGRSTGGKSNN